PLAVPSVTITASPGTTVGSGATVTFTANVVNGGPTPRYQRKKNMAVVDSNATYIASELKNNNRIQREITSSDTCASPATAKSNTLTMRMTTGIEELLAGGIAIFPNPNAGSF